MWTLQWSPLNLRSDSVRLSVYVHTLSFSILHVCKRWNWTLYIFLLSSNWVVFLKASISLWLPPVPPLPLYRSRSLAVTLSAFLFLIGCCIPSFHPPMASSQWGDRIGFLLDKALPPVVEETMRWMDAPPFPCYNKIHETPWRYSYCRNMWNTCRLKQSVM